jgi:crotonobetainyl-CoA:carnitine CoA-transferase CaiB-like acyl-CoA transferase
MAGLTASFDEAIREGSEGRLAAALSEHFATHDRADALATLRRAGVPVVPVHRFGDLFDEPQAVANDLLIELRHSQWGRVTQSGILAKFSATPGVVDRAAPMLGEHNDEILATIGYSPDRIQDLYSRRVVRRG